MFVKVENFGIDSKSKRGFEKGDMHIVITIELIAIVPSIFTFQRKLIIMFSQMDSIRKFRNFIWRWRSITIVVIIIGVRGVRDNKGEKKLLIIDGEGEFDQDVLTLGKNFIIKYEQLLEAYNGSHCTMVLIKNVTTTIKGDQYLRAQHYIILTKVVEKVT